MTRVRHILPAIGAATALLALALAGCAQAAGTTGAGGRPKPAVVPERIVSAPRGLLAAAAPQPDGSMWALAGLSSTGLYELQTGSGRGSVSVSVSTEARSVAESPAGVVGLALASRRAGSLQLWAGRTPRRHRTVALPAPARQVVTAGAGTFDVLTAWPAAASVERVSIKAGRVLGSVPVPADTVAIAPAAGARNIYVLQSTGTVDQISARGKITAKFSAGTSGVSMSLSPDGSTLYVLKNAGAAANIAVVRLATESVLRVLPAPENCRQLIVSPSGRQLYEVVGTAGYGNIQVFAA